MSRLDPLRATTRGLGETIAAAITAGSASVIVGLGGSASTDAGAGALTALGLRLMDVAGHDLPDGGAALSRLSTISSDGLLPPPPGGVRLLTDVSAPLLGQRGAAAVFAPQKGATPDEVALLEAALATFARVASARSARTKTGPKTATVLSGAAQPGAGAAGGTAYGFVTLWGASIIPGAEFIAELTGLSTAVEGADVVLTGEGKFDEQSLIGKVVGRLVEQAGAKTGVIAGQFATDPGVWSASLSTLAGSTESAMAEPERWLREAGAMAARHFGTTFSTSRAS
jgi:glycerate kinase